MSRPRNPRRILVEGMKVINAELGILRARWDISMTVHDAKGNAWRKRREYEKPENRADFWLDAYTRLDSMINGLTVMRDFAARNLNSLTKDE